MDRRAKMVWSCGTPDSRRLCWQSIRHAATFIYRENPLPRLERVGDSCGIMRLDGLDPARRAVFSEGGVMHSDVRHGGLILFVAGLVRRPGQPPLAQSKGDPLIGRWVMDRAKSEFSGAPPERRITIFELTTDGRMRHITETLVSNGSTDRVEYTSKYDGQDNPISNSFLWTVSVKRIDARTSE